MRWCAFRLPCCVNNLLHTLQVNGCSPLCVCVDVLQITLMCEGLFTHITGKGMLPTVCVGVPSDYPVVCGDVLQITLMCEGLITHITGK